MVEPEYKEGECESCGVVTMVSKITLMTGHPDMDSWLCGTCIEDEFYHDDEEED